MSGLVLSLALVFGADPQVTCRDAPTTCLYVKTSPAGARVGVDGEAAGTSNGVLRVLPGMRRITIELEGYARQQHSMEIVAGRVTRLVVKLEKPPPTSAGSLPQEESLSPPSASRAAAQQLGQAKISDELRSAMLAVLRQHPDQARWSGRAGGALFGVAAKTLPSGEHRDRTIPALLELTQMVAVQELLRAKVLLDQYAQAGLSDATTLIEAVLESAGSLEVVGTVEGLRHAAAIRGEYAVAYVAADATALSAHLRQPVELERVRTAYREVMHRQAKQLMEQQNFKDALLLWLHLHQRKLVSPSLYLDAATCFRHVDQSEDAVRVLSEALETFEASGTAEFFEKAGDAALEINTPEAIRLAERAYEMASNKLRETVTGP